MKKHKFIKIKGHPNWFLLYDGNESNLTTKMGTRIITDLLYDPHNEGKPMPPATEIAIRAASELDYQSLYEKLSTPLLIRPIGSYMPMDSSVEILDECYGYDFPIDNLTSPANIVICENGKYAEDEWRRYLKRRFNTPHGGITTINYFNTRSREYVKEIFKETQYVTFSTTFQDLEWYRILVDSLHPHNVVIGYCHNPENWDAAKEIYNNLEIIPQLKF